jgi:hypothetical protein
MLKYKNQLLAVLLSALLVSLSGCTEKGDHGSRKQIELTLKDGSSVTLVCPEYDRAPAGAYGRECYIKKAH